MKFLQRIKNLYKLSEIEVAPDKREQIENIINPERPRQAVIIKRKKSESDIINDILNTNG